MRWVGGWAGLLFAWAGREGGGQGHEHEDGELGDVDDARVEPEVEDDELHQPPFERVGRWIGVERVR